MSTTINYLQEYIKAKDNHPELVKEYFLKLSEEVGELSEAIRKNKIRIKKQLCKRHNRRRNLGCYLLCDFYCKLL